MIRMLGAAAAVGLVALAIAGAAHLTEPDPPCATVHVGQVTVEVREC